MFFLLQGCEDGITLIADNPFTNKKDLVPFEKGIRIDYILFKVSGSFTLTHLLCFYHFLLIVFILFFLFYSQGSPKTDVFCDSMSTTKGSVADQPFPYSDHEALTAELRLESHTPPGTGRDKNLKDSSTGIIVSNMQIRWHVKTVGSSLPQYLI